MRTTELDHKLLYPNSIEVTADEVIIRMPRLPADTVSETGKMSVLCTSNGWKKTAELGPFNEQLQVNIFVGSRK